MSYFVVQPQKNNKFYLYEVESYWDSEKKSPRQKRHYIGPCDKDGNLISKSTKRKTIESSPIYGSYYLMNKLAEDTGLASTLIDVYGETDGKRLLALAILGVVNPSSINMMEHIIDDTYLRELIDLDWSFEQSSVCRFMQSVGKNTTRRDQLFEKLAPSDGCIIFDIVCLGTDSELLDFAETGRKARITGSSQVNLGMVHSMKDNLPFCYKIYPGSVADVSTLENLISDLKLMNCKVFEIVMDRGFFSVHNITMMIEKEAGFTIPVPSRNKIEKLLISESVSEIDSPLCTDILCGSTVRGYESHVALSNGEFVKASADDDGAIRAVVFQDDDRRNVETRTLYKRIFELEDKLSDMKYEKDFNYRLTRREKETAELFDFSEDENGMLSMNRKRNAISAKENACGRFVVITTSNLEWKDLLLEYRKRNEVEYDFSQLQSDLFNGITGKSNQDSADGGILVNFLSLRLRLTLINRMKEKKLTDKMWVPEVLAIMNKLKISCIGGEWRLNEVTKTQRELFEKLGVKNP